MLERMARPLRGLSNGIASVMDAVYRPLGGPGKLLQDFLNGSWLGHSLHAVLVDVVIGAATAALLLDVLRVFFSVDGLETATTWVIGLAYLSAVGSILTGLTDYKDTAPNSGERDVAGLHGLVNIVATGFFAFSFFARLGGGHDAAFWLLLVGYLVVSIGGYIGGHVVFKYGYMVNHNAFSKGKRAKEFTPVIAVAELPEETPTKVDLRDDVGDARPPRRRGARPQGDLLACGWPALEGRAQGRHDHLPVALLDLPPHRWVGRARAGRLAAGLVPGTRQRGPGGAPGAVRLTVLPAERARRIG